MDAIPFWGNPQWIVFATVLKQIKEEGVQGCFGIELLVFVSTTDWPSCTNMLVPSNTFKSFQFKTYTNSRDASSFSPIINQVNNLSEKQELVCGHLIQALMC